jgi:Family of unknown function (DUF5994)
VKGLLNGFDPRCSHRPGLICASPDADVNGLTGPRRMARPVRLSLAPHLGGDIDGAWWPHTSSVAQELPELVGSLHEPLGEILDIRINWSMTEGALDLESMVQTSRLVAGKRRRPRIMVVDGRGGCAKLLVVPHITSQTLGALVMRCAAAMPFSDSERGNGLIETAELVMRTAQVESANWVAGMRSVSSAKR